MTLSNTNSNQDDLPHRMPIGKLGGRAGLACLAGVLLLPVFGVLVGAFGTSSGTWDHLVQNVLFDYVVNTIGLLLIVAVLTTLIGTSTAWLVAATDFPGRRILEWLLVLPIAAPAYIIAYVYTDLLEFAGPVQSTLRAITGWTADAYWFPQIRSLTGAGLMLSLVLYPYVYLLARSAFLNDSGTQFQAARSLGASPFRAFVRISLPAAKAAIFGGVILALMETAADFGVADYFGIPTFSTGIYRSWYAIGDQVAALRLAGVLLFIMGTFVVLERLTRRDQRGRQLARDYAISRMRLNPIWSAVAVLTCVLPVLLGFVVPALRLGYLSLSNASLSFTAPFWSAAWNSVTLSVLAALATLIVTVVMVYAQRGRARSEKRHLAAFVTRVTSLGYALPGTLLAVGLLLPLVSFDKWIAQTVYGLSGIQTGLILTGSVIVLIYAYVIRFSTVAFNAVEPALSSISHQMDEAARTLGASSPRILKDVHFPLLRPALYSAFLLVFIDTMRELPATLLLRPFNFETLATQTYRLASDERLVEAAPAALLLILAGLIPVMLINRLTRSG